VDRAAWFKGSEAARKITKGQRPIVKELFHRLDIEGSGRRKTSRPRHKSPIRAQRQ